MSEIPGHLSPPYSEDSRDDALFHYTSADGLIGILQSGEIWGTAYYCSNDESELAAGKGILTPEFLRATDKMIQDNDPLDYPAEVQLRLAHGKIFGIVDAVRNLVLNWSLELEKAGILGEDMIFSGKDKKEAAPITQQFFAQNIGVVGNVSDQAQVANEQAATMEVNLDVAAVQDFATQTRQALPLLPENARSQLKSMIADLEEELTQGVPNQSRLRDLMGSVRTICEGAAGNLAAQGILGMLGNLL